MVTEDAASCGMIHNDYNEAVIGIKEVDLTKTRLGMEKLTMVVCPMHMGCCH